MNGHASCFRTRLAHLDFRLIFVSITLIISLSTNAARAKTSTTFPSPAWSPTRAARSFSARPSRRRSPRRSSARVVVTDGVAATASWSFRPACTRCASRARGFAAEERRDLGRSRARRVRLDFTLRPAGVAAEQTVVSEADAPLVDTTRTVVGRHGHARGIGAAAALDALAARLRVHARRRYGRTALDARRGRRPRRSRARRARAARRPKRPARSRSRAARPTRTTSPLTASTTTTTAPPANASSLSLEAVEEVQVITHQFSAEYGRASGGRVNLRTRAGSNRLRGRVFHFFRDESLDANTWNNNRRGLGRLPASGAQPRLHARRPRRAAKPLRAARLRRKRPHVLLRRLRARPRSRLGADRRARARRTEPVVSAAAPDDARRPSLRAGRPRSPTRPPNSRPSSSASRRRKARTASPRASTTTTRRAQRHIPFQLGARRTCASSAAAPPRREFARPRARHGRARLHGQLRLLPDAVNQLRAQLSRLRPRSRASGARPVVLVKINDPLTRTTRRPLRHARRGSSTRARPTVPRRAFNFRRRSRSCAARTPSNSAATCSASARPSST